ncbi:peptidylprolyl isomerase [bacterium]|nr:peptidylprolyl isomerase [bacterium]MBU1634051.1 peptidylprolyl isomerase [bacterium]MBU1872266.1 peptidylprolyl isomerase [bacterium]
MKIQFILVFLLSVTIVFAGSLSKKGIDELNRKVQILPDVAVSPDDVVVIETDFGEIVFEFFPYVAPIHAMNFKKLITAGYFDSTTFHRVIPGFMIQGGDILSRDDNIYNDGTGGPEYTIQAEFGKKHVRGSVASARAGDQVNPEKRSNGSQFYICVQDQPYLDKMGYTVFGQVIKGIDVVDKIVKVRRNSHDRPLKDVIMNRVYISKKSKIKLD